MRSRALSYARSASADATEPAPDTWSRRLAASLPSLRLGLSGAALWATAMAASAAAKLVMSGWQTTESITQVAAVYACGGALAFPLAYAAAGLLRQRRVEGRIAVALFAFTFVTIACTAIVYTLDYQRRFAESEGEPPPDSWLMDLAYGVAGAFGQFAITGVRLYFPFGFVAVLIVAAWYACRPLPPVRPERR